MAGRWQVQPLGLWAPRPVTRDRQSSAVFRATWEDTMFKLLDDVDLLAERGQQPVVTLHVLADPADIRSDGMLRTRAKVDFPGVVVSFDSRHGRLSYTTDRYERRWDGQFLEGWQANVRAIMLALQALRAVDRYGVTRAGEQYAGWRALEAGPSTRPPTMTREEAQKVLDRAAFPGATSGPLPASEEGWRRLYAKARRNAHPDVRQGDESMWHDVQTAARVLGLDGGGSGG